MPCHIHHTVGNRSPGKHTYGRHGYYHPEGCHLRPDCRVDEIDGIVAYAYHEVEYRKDAQKNHYAKKYYFHLS